MAGDGLTLCYLRYRIFRKATQRPDFRCTGNYPPGRPEAIRRLVELAAEGEA